MKCIKTCLVVFAAVLCASPVWAAETIKVGQLAALTGDHAAYGQAERDAVEMAVEEINAAGGVLGRQIELVVYDNRTRNEDTVIATRRLVDDGVCAIIGPNGSGMHIAAAPIIDSAGIPQIGTLPTNEMVTVDETGKTRQHNFRICFQDNYQSEVIAYFAANNLQKKKAAILYDVSSEYSQGLREFFLAAYEKYGGTVLADEAYRLGDRDFRAQLTSIANTDAEVLVLPNLGPDMALIIKQARELGMADISFIGGDAYGEFMWEIAGDALEGSYWVSHVAPDDTALASFFENYRKKFGRECSEFMNGVLAYDCVYWLADAITRAGSDDPAKISEALAATQGLKLLHATLTIDEQHNPKGKDAVILIAKDNLGRFFTRVGVASE